MIASKDLLPEGIREKPFFRMLAIVMDHVTEAYHYENINKLQALYDVTASGFEPDLHVENLVSSIVQLMDFTEEQRKHLLWIAHGIYNLKGTVKILRFLLDLYGFENAVFYDTQEINNHLGLFGESKPLECTVIIRITNNRANDYNAYYSLRAALDAFLWICITWQIRIVQEVEEENWITDSAIPISTVTVYDENIPKDWYELFCPMFPKVKRFISETLSPADPKYWEFGNTYPVGVPPDIDTLIFGISMVYSDYLVYQALLGDPSVDGRCFEQLNLVLQDGDGILVSETDFGSGVQDWEYDGDGNLMPPLGGSMGSLVFQPDGLGAAMPRTGTPTDAFWDNDAGDIMPTV